MKNILKTLTVCAAFASATSYSYLNASDANAQIVSAGPVMNFYNEDAFIACRAQCTQTSFSAIDVNLAAFYQTTSVFPHLARLQSNATAQDCINAAQSKGCAFRHHVNSPNGVTEYRCKSIFVLPLQSQFSQTVSC